MKRKRPFLKYFPASNILLVFFCSLLLLCFIFYSNYRTRQANIADMEQGAIAEISLNAEALFDQTKTVASAMSLNSIGGELTDLTREEYLKYSSTQQLLTLSMSMHSYMSGITVHNQEHALAVGTGFQLDTPNAQQLSTNKSFQVYRSTEVLNTLLCVLEANPAGHAKNDVYISLNTYNMGRSIFEQTSESRCELIVDRDGYIVISDRTNYFGKNVFALFSLDPVALTDQSQTLFTDGSKIITYAPVSNMELFAITVSDTDYYLSAYNTTILESTRLAAILICVMVIVSIITAKIAYRPIQEVLTLLGKFSPVTQSDYIDEIDYINDTINSMHTANSALARTVNESIAELKKQQLAALQAQISPHFLFNTLDAVNWVAIDALGVGNTVSTSILKTKRVLRSGIDSYHFFATVADEVSCSSDCLDILKLRYGIDFDLAIQLTEEQKKCRILKNCLQPILENAVFHGFAGKTVENAAIRIVGTEQAGDLIISISNNGTPVSKKELDELTMMVNEDQSDSSEHVGLRNVHRRLQLLFGDQYGLSFSWDKEAGFTCRMRLPFVK